MARSWWIRFSLLVGLVLFSVAYVYPTLSNLDVAKTRFPFKQKMNLGLDLQGGLYLVLGVDFKKLYQEILTRQMLSLSEKLKEKTISVSRCELLKQEQASDDPRIVVAFEANQRNALYDLVKQDFSILRLAAESAGQFELGLSYEHKNSVKERTVNQSIEVIRNRIDEFGVSEPSITSQGNDRVVVELPGVREIDRAKDLIGRTALLEFKIVDEEWMSSPAWKNLVQSLEKQVPFEEGQRFSDYVKKWNELARGKIPQEDEIAFERTQSGSERQPYLLHAKTAVSGADLQDATVQIDPEGQRPYVGFSLHARGAKIFDQLTGDHIGHRLAIVLDQIVHSAPVIQTRIGEGRGQITLGRGGVAADALMKEAKDLAIVLRAGALPAQLDFLEQRVVGPSLGQDSIRSAALASLVGSLLVFLFVGIYYRVSGLIAVISLMLNVLFVLACLVGLEATLTLPGIAGIALTVGIAVDSNVVIYERIREEVRHGKWPVPAVEAGFQKAFRTILDANVTNAAAGVVLLLYGTGPIKGFAVTLLIGIFTTLFTAVFVCRLMFTGYLKFLVNRGSKTLSI